MGNLFNIFINLLMKFIIAILLGVVAADELKVEAEVKVEGDSELEKEVKKETDAVKKDVDAAKTECTKDNGDDKCKKEVEGKGCCFLTEIIALPKGMEGGTDKGDTKGECNTEADMKEMRLAIAKLAKPEDSNMVEMMKARWETSAAGKKEMQEQMARKVDAEQKWDDFWKTDEVDIKAMDTMFKEYRMNMIGCHNVAASVTAGAAALTAAAFFM